MEEHFLKQLEGSRVPLEISTSNRFYPYFKDCVGALDGTHVAVKVSSVDAPRYRGRKGYPTVNVLAACTFDLRFTYVLPGWEGTASDSRIIKNALTREDKLKIPNERTYEERTRIASKYLPLYKAILNESADIRRKSEHRKQLLALVQGHPKR
ncbi:hypothetical protein Vadar_023496 [Vaccinium darrowii]|uniref:Uncharacterized protein n=1 Tax=Vaccinium darrowii TaxID=229202 RepID=A0ACB7XKL3_9ERIC|nr:hypothetical protein Vadar_023496 [Vaccinium darrowii]